VITDRGAAAKDRRRALDLMTCFGPPPSPELLIELARDADPAMRVRACRLMGNRPEVEFSEPLANAVQDSEAWVRRTACESITHRGSGAPTEKLIGLLADPDRFVAFAARRALERVPAAEWQEPVLTSSDPRTFLQGATGLLVAHPSPETARQIVARCEAMMRGDVQEPGKKRGHISDPTFLDLLRVVQLALIRGEIAATEVPSLGEQMLREYPTKHHPRAGRPRTS
jgi:hypothetical protein